MPNIAMPEAHFVAAADEAWAPAPWVGAHALPSGMPTLQQLIRAEAHRQVQEHETYCSRLAEEAVRRQRRSTVRMAPLRPIRPDFWRDDPGFDPYKVRANADFIGRAVAERLKGGNYVPLAPALFQVPKADGSLRDVNVFQIADAVVSTRAFQSLSLKNAARFSARSFAYRQHISAFDALQFLDARLAGKDRIFIAEFDFRKFFDSIDHEYLRRTLRDLRFLVSREEWQVIEGFLAAPRPTVPYDREGEVRARDGVPQGTSISLFLANVAATPLDGALEGLGVGFVRYADDTVIFDASYDRVNRAVQRLHEISIEMGVSINREKSPGVRLLTADPRQHTEMHPATGIDFLGHHVRPAGVSIKKSVVERIKRHCLALVYNNLLREPIAGTLDPTRMGSVDRDYVVLVSQLRRYIYGNASEHDLSALLRREPPRKRFKGLMSFFPLVDDEEQLRQLDDWLALTISFALKKRGDLVAQLGMTSPPPIGFDVAELRRFKGVPLSSGRRVDLRPPKFSRAAAVVRKAALVHGAAAVGRGSPLLYTYGV